MMSRLVGTAFDGHVAARRSGTCPGARARTACWIARNVLASLRPRVELASAAAARRAFEVQAPEPVRVLVALAARPALVDPATISRRCRLALALLGIPVLAEPRAAAFAAGVPVLVGEPASRGGGALRMLAA